VLFTKLRGREANVRRFNRVDRYGGSTKGSWKTLIPNQWCTWAPGS